MLWNVMQNCHLHNGVTMYMCSVFLWQILIDHGNVDHLQYVLFWLWPTVLGSFHLLCLGVSQLSAAPWIGSQAFPGPRSQFKLRFLINRSCSCFPIYWVFFCKDELGKHLWKMMAVLPSCLSFDEQQCLLSPGTASLLQGGTTTCKGGRLQS